MLRHVDGVQMEVMNVLFQGGRNAEYRRESRILQLQINASHDLALTLPHLIANENTYSMKFEPKQKRSNG